MQKVQVPGERNGKDTNFLNTCHLDIYAPASPNGVADIGANCAGSSNCRRSYPANRPTTSRSLFVLETEPKYGI